MINPMREIVAALALTAWGLFIGWALDDIRRGKAVDAWLTILKALVCAWLLFTVVFA